MTWADAAFAAIAACAGLLTVQARLDLERAVLALDSLFDLMGGR